MIYMFLSNNPSSGDINSSNLSCFLNAGIQFLNCTSNNLRPFYILVLEK